MMLSVYHTLFQHYALMFLQELQFTGGKRCFCSYLALRDSVGQIVGHKFAVLYPNVQKHLFASVHWLCESRLKQDVTDSKSSKRIECS